MFVDMCFGKPISMCKYLARDFSCPIVLQPQMDGISVSQQVEMDCVTTNGTAAVKIELAEEF